MSTQDATALARGAYTNSYEFDDGFNAWQAAGHAFNAVTQSIQHRLHTLL